MGPVVIQTTRLNLREWTAEDAEAMVEIFSDPEVTRFINAGDPIPLEEAEAFVARQMTAQTERGWCRWAVQWREPAEGEPDGLLGFTGFGCHFAPEIELGWSLGVNVWGRGLATEAASAALAYGFRTVGFDHVISVIDQDNERSRRVAEKLGYWPGGTIQHEGLELLRMVRMNPLVPPPDAVYRRDCDGAER